MVLQEYIKVNLPCILKIECLTSVINRTTIRRQKYKKKLWAVKGVGGLVLFRIKVPKHNRGIVSLDLLFSLDFYFRRTRRRKYFVRFCKSWSVKPFWSTAIKRNYCEWYVSILGVSFFTGIPLNFKLNKENKSGHKDITYLCRSMHRVEKFSGAIFMKILCM